MAPRTRSGAGSASTMRPSILIAIPPLAGATAFVVSADTGSAGVVVAGAVVAGVVVAGAVAAGAVGADAGGGAAAVRRASGAGGRSGSVSPWPQAAWAMQYAAAEAKRRVVAVRDLRTVSGSVRAMTWERGAGVAAQGRAEEENLLTKQPFGNKNTAPSVETVPYWTAQTRRCCLRHLTAAFRLANSPY